MEIKVFNELQQDCIFIRNEVFVKEQKFENEFDDIDKISKHIVLYNDNKAVGTCRVFKEDNHYVIGRVAVLINYRSGGYGKKLVIAAEEVIKSLGGSDIKISAQVRIKDFYQKLGYVMYGEEYLDEYCPHITMLKSI